MDTRKRTILFVTRHGKFLGHFFVNGFIHGFNETHGIGCQLNGPTKPLECAGLFKNGNLDVRHFGEGLGQGETTYACTSDQDVQRIFRCHIIAGTERLQAEIVVDGGRYGC